MDEVDLAQRCAQGDDTALRKLFEAHEPSLRRLLIRVVGNLQDAEELSGEVFVRFWKTAHRFRGDCSLRAYLARIALNLGRDRLRKRGPNPLPESEISISGAPVAASSWSPFGHEMAGVIQSAVLQLSSDDREVLTMYYLDEWTYPEICAALGLGYDVLRTRLVRARKRLRVILDVEGVMPGAAGVIDER